MEDSIMQKCPTILSDFIVGAKAFKEARKYRKQGATGIQVVPVKAIPVIDIGYWSWTPEACLPFTREIRKSVEALFQTFDKDLQSSLTFCAKDGEWTERVKMWQEALKPALTTKQYSAAILTIMDWAVRCKQYHLGLRENALIEWR